ncbi:hypothetical protein Q8A67_006035 [Cirrhinus molitorella]|uniref:Sushi domain-containing protein n=1 Tax=Cirrhinus molitorella TaxID=172907 RepID=A0AA88Q5G7_9TELE|nr:hypothetical protein Q8A67_006035 [Cirrhinus molitorella]
MRVPVKLLCFGIWLLSLHCAQCQECLRENIKYENAEPAEKVSYDDGETLKVNCMTGYTGFYRLKCEKGEWKASIERQCAKKKCSHPGDTQNGDFKLTEGTEFVFGATVVYTCKKGYEMASRINQRTCRAQGWDNAVPLCEVVKCPAIRTDGEVTASGNTEEGSYGDVIHFECLSSEKMIFGSSDIHCTEMGKWSDDVPKCKEITCTAPVIKNGEVVDHMPEYRKGAILEYKCNEKFKKREGIPKCAKFGWTIKPECDEVTCSLGSTTFGIKNINPEGKTIFKVGEIVTITCSEKHWLILTKETSRSFTCQANGDWDHTPVCAEIKCEFPRNQHVRRLEYSWEEPKLGKILNYYCENGYDKMADSATCTKNGWTPNPLCAKTCAAPNIPNAEIVRGLESKYVISSRIEYQCNPGFKPEEPVEIICNSRQQWTGYQKCTEKVCAAPNIPNANIGENQQQNYRINAKIHYQCNPGFEPKQPVTITCDSKAQWTGIQQCTVKTCLDPSVENGWFIYNHPSNKEQIVYSCDTHYKPFTGNWWDMVTCSDGSWSEKPRCIPKEECGALPSADHGKPQQFTKTFLDGQTTKFACDPGFKSKDIKCIHGTWEKPVCKEDVRCYIPPKVENAVITSKPEDFYVDGSNVTYKCRSSFSINGDSTVFCHNGNWTETPTCGAQCQKPRKNFMKLANEKDVYDNEEILNYKCIEPYNEIPEGRFICKNGKWRGNFDCTSKTCPPPPYVENGDYIIRDRDGKVITEVQYTCKSHYVLSKQKQYYKCVNGMWETPPTCLTQCQKPHKNFMQLVNEKDVYNNEEILNYKCIEPYNEIPEGRLICKNGNWSGNFDCTSKICPPPPYVENGDYIIRDRDGEVITEVQYNCKSYYVLSTQQQYYKCENGIWETPPTCLKPCEITPEIFEVHNLYPIQQKDYLKYGERREVYCKQILGIWTQASITCSNGKLNVGPCRRYQ